MDISLILMDKRTSIADSKIFSVLFSFLFFFFLIFFQFKSLPLYAQSNNDEKPVKVAFFETDNFQEGCSDDSMKSGYAYEIYQKISDYTGWDYEYVYGNWTDLYNQFINGEIDLFAGLAYYEGRELFMDFPDYEIDIEYHSLFIKRDNNSITTKESLNGKKIGIIQGLNITSEFMNWVHQNNIIPEYVYYYNSKDMIDDLESGVLDGIINSERNIDSTRNIYPFICFKEAKSYICVRKGAKKLFSEINDALEEIALDSPGFYLDLKKHYYSHNPINKTLSKKEQQWVDTHPVVRLGFVEDYLPFSAVDSDGNITGVLKDIIDAWKKELSLEKLNIVYVGYTGQNEMVEALNRGEIDIIYPISKNAWYSEKSGIMTSMTLFELPMSAVFKGEYSDDIFKRIAVSDSKSVQKIFIQNYYPNAEMVQVESGVACLKSIIDGNADSSIFTNVRLAGYMSRSEFKSLSYVPLEGAVAYCFAVLKGNSTLLSLINHGIGLIDKSHITESMYRNLDYYASYSSLDFLRDHFIVFFGCILIFIFILLFAVSAYIHVNKKRIEIETQIQAEREEYYEIFDVLSRDYLDVYIIDPINDTSTSVKINGQVMDKSHRMIRPYGETWKNYVHKTIAPEKQSEILEIVEMQNVLTHLNQKGELVYDFQTSFNGSIHNYQIRYAFIGDEDNRTIILGFKLIDDIVEKEKQRRTDLENALEAAQQANISKTTFLNSMSHDIRTPMNAILGYTTLMENEVNNPGKMKDYLGKVKNSGDYLLTLINNVLEVARIDSGKETLDESYVDLTDENNSVYPLLENEINKKHLKFSQKMNIQHKYVYMDIQKIKEITMNLMSNAIKYTPEGGSINLMFEEIPSEKEGYATYVNSISDSGIGMSEKFQKKIFESFSRERDTTESKIVGSGLGMAIVKKLVDMMEGQVCVESELGKGSTFKVIISHRIAEKTENYLENQKNTTYEKDINIEGKRILLAEDNELNAEIASEILATLGFKVDCAADGVICVDMLTRAEKGYYDLILMDIQMPNLNGYDAARKIRALGDKEKANIPIIAMTANAFEEDKKNALAVGMNNHLAKPIEVHKLYKVLAEVLGESE